MQKNNKVVPNISNNTKNFLRSAAWIGLIAGLVEAVAFVISIHLGRPLTVWYEIVWISPLVYLIGYSLVGLVFVLLQRYLPRVPVFLLGVMVMIFVTIFDWVGLVLTNRVHILALLILALGLTTVIIRFYNRYQLSFLRLCRKSLPILLVLEVLLFIGVEGGMWLDEQVGLSRLPDPPAGAPNILVIVVDTLRSDHLSTYGYERPTSPFIDQVAAEGVLFENAYAASSYSFPSHASLFTGLALHDHQAEWNNKRALFNLAAPVFPELLLSQGYRTGAFSANTFWVTRKEGFGRGFLHFEDYFTTFIDYPLHTGLGQGFEKFIFGHLKEQKIPVHRLASEINQRALKWIDQLPNKPFFVFLNYIDVHDPYLPPQPYRSMFSTQAKPGGLLNQYAGREFIDLTPEQLQGEIDAYDGSIRYVDDQISNLLKELESRGLADNLLVVILSDHGEAFGEHGVYLHGNSLYREELHVPLIFYWPGHLSGGVRLNQPVSIDSMGSTILDMIGSSSLSEFPGPSLVSLWQGNADTTTYPMPLAEIYAKSWFNPRSIVKTNSLSTLLNDQWQYIQASILPEELYNFTNDKMEIQNQANNPANEDVMTHFRTEMKTRTPLQTKAQGSLGE